MIDRTLRYSGAGGLAYELLQVDDPRKISDLELLIGKLEDGTTSLLHRPCDHALWEGSMEMEQSMNMMALPRSWGFTFCVPCASQGDNPSVSPVLRIWQ